MKHSMQTTIGEGRAIVTATADVVREDGLVWVDLESVTYMGIEIFDALSADQIDELENAFVQEEVEA